MGDRMSVRKRARLAKEATTLARQRYKTPGTQKREADINADFERDMRARDAEPAERAPVFDPGE